MKSFKPVFLCEMKGAAETQHVANVRNAKNDVNTVVVAENVSGYRVKGSSRLVDRWLDKFVRFAGSAPVFLIIVSGLLTWALMGIRFGNSDVWVAAISDVQAILCYVFDSLLMRQLLREYTEQREAMVEIMSRCNSHHRMLLKVKNKLGSEGIRQVAEKCQDEPLEPLDHGARTQSLFARCIIFSAKRFGHIITVGMYWVCIFIWLGFGPKCNWSNRWQLYINDATSALMVLVFAFLACLRECYADYTNICLDAIFRLDSTLEVELRLLSEDDVPNSVEVDVPPKENYLMKVIYYYADIVGTLVGMLVLVAVVITWAALGPVFQFNNTWWLLIGTYAGLVGLFDSFVLRNVQNKVHQNTKCQVRNVEAFDVTLFAGLSVPIPAVKDSKAPSLSRRVSRKMDAVSSHYLMVVAGFLLTIGCLVASSAMRWSLTGQLISNVPPSIIETFFMLILITGQNDAEADARVDLTNIYYRRQRLLSFMKHASDYCQKQDESEAAPGAQ
ncbi:Low-affinity iron/zinc ion transport protein fet4 [Penicillium rolfsii]|nr:Low-affinity iron/zinc ion transport protein fet4 [Penicillium rolfsii]